VSNSHFFVFLFTILLLKKSWEDVHVSFFRQEKIIGPRLVDVRGQKYFSCAGFLDSSSLVTHRGNCTHSAHYLGLVFV